MKYSEVEVVYHSKTLIMEKVDSYIILVVRRVQLNLDKK